METVLDILVRNGSSMLDSSDVTTIVALVRKDNETEVTGVYDEALPPNSMLAVQAHATPLQLRQITTALK
jgi:hypothetical protein